MKSKSTWVVLTFLIGGALLAFVLDLALTSLFVRLGVRNDAILGDGFTLSTLIGFVVAIAAAGGSYSRKKTKTFVGDVVDELSKVSWPEWSETKVNTLVVIVFSFISAAILGVFDSVFSYITDHNFWLY